MKLVVNESVRALVDAEPDVRKKVGILAGFLVRQAARLTENGFTKRRMVRDTIKAALVGDDASENDVEQLVDDLTPFSGLAEVASDFVIEVLPMERYLDELLELVVDAMYRAMKDVGMIRGVPPTPEVVERPEPDEEPEV